MEFACGRAWNVPVPGLLAYQECLHYAVGYCISAGLWLEECYNILSCGAPLQHGGVCMHCDT